MQNSSAKQMDLWKSWKNREKKHNVEVEILKTA